LRRSIAAWRKRGTLEQFGQRLVAGMTQRGYTETFARRIFSQILGFGEYGFPESHAASFALLVYVSAWLKHHHPAAFVAALLDSQPMGFYAPSQLVQEARRMGVEVRPVDARISGWECALEGKGRNTERTEKQGGDGEKMGAAGQDFPIQAYQAPINAGSLPGSSTFPKSNPAIRLGLRMVKGFSQAGAERLVAARQAGPFASVTDLARRALLNRSDLQALAAADALRGLAGNRRRAVWAVSGIEAPRPLLPEQPEPAVPLLRPPTEGEAIVADYASLGLTLGRNPLALLRPELQRRGLRTAQQVRDGEHGRALGACGIVINRQRPGSAHSVTFVTLEDESGQINLVVWKQLAERYRVALLGAQLLGVWGEVQREGEVVHLIARRLFDLSGLLGGLTTRSRDFH